MTTEPNGSPAPQHRLADLRDWLMDQIDGSIETRGDDGLISDFIRQIDALSEKGATVEPRGCPTPGSCSAVAEIADLKQRLLPQFQGRAQRAEHERDALLEELIVRRTAIANLHEEINGMRGAAPSATRAPVAWCVAYDDPRMGRIHSNATMNKLQAAELAARRGLALVPLYAASVEVTAIGNARYEYIRTLNPRKFAELYNEAMVGVYQFDDLVDCYRDAGER